MLVLWLFRRVSFIESRFFHLRKFASVYGIVGASDETKSERTTTATTKKSWFLKVFDRGGYALEYEERDEDRATATLTAIAPRSPRRGYERWKAAYCVKAEWRLFGVPFESVTTIYLGRIHLVYTSAILPEAEWEYFDPAPFSQSTGDKIQHKLKTILTLNADGANDGRLEIPEDAEPGSLVGYVPQLPDFVVQAIPNSHQLLSLRQRRAYVSLTSTALQEMYSNAEEVRAVILHSYLERILEKGCADFLFQGKVTHRLVAFPDAKARLALTDNSARAYRDFFRGLYTSSAC
jgi:hypothetical protein